MLNTFDKGTLIGQLGSTNHNAQEMLLFILNIFLIGNKSY